MSLQIIQKINDHAERAKALLVQQFKEKTGINKIIGVFSAEVQALENALYQLVVERDIDNGYGATLDLIGRILNEPRLGKTDIAYRLFLKAAISRSISQGEPERLISLLKDITESVYVTLDEIYPARVEMTFDGAMANISYDRLIRIMKTVKAAGVSLGLVQVSANPFIIASVTAGIPAQGGGFGTVVAGNLLGGELGHGVV